MSSVLLDNMRLTAESAFRGDWEDDEGTVVTLKDGIMSGPDGPQLKIQYVTASTCEFTMDEETFRGSLCDGCNSIKWDDGCVWKRVRSEAVDEIASSKKAPANLQTLTSSSTKVPATTCKKPSKDNPNDKEEEDRAWAEFEARQKLQGRRWQQHLLDRRPASGDTAVTAQSQDKADKEKQSAENDLSQSRRNNRWQQHLQSRLQQSGDTAVAKDNATQATNGKEDTISQDRARKAFAEELSKRKVSKGKEESPGLDQARMAFAEQLSKRKAVVQMAAKSTTLLQDATAVPTEPKHSTGSERARRLLNAARSAQAHSGENAKPETVGPRGRGGAFSAALDFREETIRSANFSSTRPSPSASSSGRVSNGDVRQMGKPRTGGLGFGVSGLRSGVDNQTAATTFRTGGRIRGRLDGTDALARLGVPARGCGIVENIIVRTVALQARPELNGAMGLTIKYFEQQGRWQVRLNTLGDMLLKPDNLIPVSADEYETTQAMRETEVDERKIELDAKKIKTRTSNEKMRWCCEESGPITIRPGDNGNEFDILMVEETDGIEAADKVVTVLEQRGVCLVEANAPADLLSDAFEEAEWLWNRGHFKTTWHRRYDETDFESSFNEAKLWNDTLFQDESDKVIWLNPEDHDPELDSRMRSLHTLASNIQDFATGLGEPLGVNGCTFTHMWSAMLSCYSGERAYNIQLDNPHRMKGNLPDNGLRLTLCYFINPHWNPQSDQCDGGLDIYLTDPTRVPETLTISRKAERIRIAPHADSLAIFLSESMAHQVISTTSRERWYCLTVWCFDQDALANFYPSVQEMRFEWEQRQRGPADDSGSESE